MTYQYTISENKAFLLNFDTNIYTPTNLNKLFHGEILDQHYNLLESSIRHKYMVGIFSTSQTQRFGKNKKGNIIYFVKPIQYNLPNFLISYGGKLKGKIAIKFKFTKWDEKLPSGEIIDVIGLFDSINLNNILMYHYNLYPKKNNKLEKNPLEVIERRNYQDIIFSIDPDDCVDIDDALSIKIENDFTIIGVHIAQPICWINLKDLHNKINNQFSTLYLPENRKDLWGEKITQLASLFPNENKPAYTTLFYYQNNKLIKTEDFASTICNNHKLSYDNADICSQAVELKLFTKNLSNCDDYHDVVSYWMVKTNSYIGSKLSNIPYRVNHFNNVELPDLSEDIGKKFMSKKIDSAYYSLEETFHQSLGINKYTHFTSPIRRYIDTWVHYYLTYPDVRGELKLNLDLINDLDTRTKKFHRELELNDTINRIFADTEMIETIGYIYQIISNNMIEIYIDDIGFFKIKLYPIKFDYLIEKEKNDNNLMLKYQDKTLNYKIGDTINITLNYKNDVLPKNKIIILPSDCFSFI